MNQIKAYARIGAGACALVAAACSLLAMLWSFTSAPESVVIAGPGHSQKVALAMAIALGMLATSIGFLYFPRLAAVMGLAMSFVTLVGLVLLPTHVGAARGISLLLVGPVVASLGVLRVARRRQVDAVTRHT